MGSGDKVNARGMVPSNTQMGACTRASLWIMSLREKAPRIGPMELAMMDSGSEA